MWRIEGGTLVLPNKVVIRLHVVVVGPQCLWKTGRAMWKTVDRGASRRRVELVPRPQGLGSLMHPILLVGLEGLGAGSGRKELC